ncbi:mycothiol synthase [Humibacter ginsenosidimutans]|uniref:Mycothiol acetyltransferase n=1 Tax=Humibacter ginsenosidimutans TaxID=2599293 RepID=A0A5B8M3Q6_9MICO|nr:mycothiol synthase [Humibacter ginsenosidimutans]QDZ14791.1 mycothiol synthase [Humibacter ginsenosidimutans]
MSDGATPFGLSVDTVDGDGLSDVLGVADAARDDDGVDPFNEQTRLDLASGRRVGHVGTAGGVPVAAAATGAGQLDLVVLPAKRGNGYGSAMLGSLLPVLERDASAWSHGDHPAARALAASHGFDRVRVLLRLRLDELPAGDDAGAGEAVGTGPATDGIQFESFDAERDAADWLALNARAFASHPEQGGMTADDLRERMDEDWFDPHDFLVARDATGLMLGFHWMKLEPDSDDAEVYVLGVAPDASGRGLGRRLLAAGLRHMRERGRTSSSLYVEGDNRPALALYRSVGFVDDAVDVQYRRLRVGS